MFNLERSASSRKVAWPTLVGLVLVPLVVAGGFLWANWNSDQRLGRVQAAVVNLDHAVTINKQIVPLGRQLAGGLVASKESQNFTWVLSDSGEAASGLASGRYAAVVTIPKSFSANATSYSKKDTTAVQAATIDVQTSPITGIADPVVGQEIASVATRALNTQLTEGYLQNIYVGFNTLNKQFATVSDAAGQLSDGTTKLAKGIDSASDGTVKFATGLEQLDTGAAKLSTGTGQLSIGLSSLSNGLNKLADGTAKLPAQTRQLANGARNASDGAAQLASGAKKLDRNLPAFTSGASKNAAGTKAYAAGATTYRKGVQKYAAGADQYAAGLQKYQQAIKDLGKGTPAQLAKIVPCPAQLPAASCPVFYAGLQAGVQVGTGAAVQGLTDQGKLPGLLTGAKALSSGADQLSDGAGKLSSGASQLSSGAAQLNTGAQAIAGGVHGVSGGVSQLSTGLGKLADGTDRLATGTKALSKGISGVADGGSKLAAGATKLADGASQLADGASQSSTGADKLSAGLISLSDGGTKLADGSRKLADGLKKGKDQVPTYDKSAREKLSSVVTNPVTSERPSTVFADVATTTFLAVLALWIGALATYLVLRAVSSKALTSMKSSWRLALEGLLPGLVTSAVQALALTVVLQILLNLSAGQTIKTLGFALLAGIAFVAVNHALVAWFGGVGRFASVVLVVLAAAGAITSAVPGLFDDLRPFLPLTPALQGLRAIASDGTGTGGSVGLLLAWLVVGAVASVLAVARRRVVSPLAVATAS
jgi:putative membrane protein